MIEKEGRLVSSYSQIDMFLGCPRKWYYRYKLGIKEMEKAKALEYGLAIHEVNEAFFKYLKENEKPWDKNELLALYNFFFDMHDIPFDTVEESQEAYNQGINMIKRLYEPVTDFDKLLVKSPILGVEENFELVINDVAIIGFIDLILQNNGIIAVDHKSGGKVFPKEKLEVNLQFPIYAMAILEKYGEMPCRNLYNFTRLQKSQEVNVDKEKMEWAKKEISKVFKKMGKEGEQFFTAKQNYCGWCPYGKNHQHICKDGKYDFKYGRK